jgi:hypothetical protein
MQKNNKTIHVIIFGFLFFSNVALGNSSMEPLQGSIMLVTDTGKEIPANNVLSIRTVDNLIPIVKKEEIRSGYFSFDLKNENITGGEKVKLIIDCDPQPDKVDTTTCDGWSIYAPINGEFYIPKHTAKETIDIRLIANKSEINIDQYTATFNSTNVYMISGLNEFYVQAFATQSFEKAIDAQNTLFENRFMNASIINAHSTKSNSGLDQYYKIIVGPYKNKNTAKDALDRLRRIDVFKDSFQIR